MQESQWIQEEQKQEERKSNSSGVTTQNLANLLGYTLRLLSKYEQTCYQEVQQSITISELQALKEKKFKDVSKKMYLNIMVVGETGLGKSTFIDALLQKKLNFPTVIRPTTTSIQEVESIFQEKLFQKANISDNLVNLNLKFIDTPGYRPSYSLKQWYNMIRNFIKDKLTYYYDKIDTQYQSIQAFQQEFADTRVHVCLYFLSGPRIKQEDFQIMKKLCQIVNVIPILAKGDSYTCEEIKIIKANFLEEITNYKIDIFDCLNSLKQGSQDPQLIKELQDGQFGPSPPFLIISSVEQYEIQPGQLIYGRKFVWGLCDIFNPKHSDLTLLYKLLIGHFSLDLVKFTDFRYKQYKKKKEQEKKHKHSKGIFSKIAAFFLLK